MRESIFLFFLTFSFWHANAFELVRDAEIEEYLYDISKPIFHSAGIEDNGIKFYLVKENSINAFVYDGANIFVNTGLIESSRTPNMLQGVIAHELGHIMGAHLIKSEPKLTQALTTYAIATILGVGILATNSSASGVNAAIASTMLGQHIAERNYLSFSRAQEAEADRYAMLFLKKSEISSDGMLELFNKLDSMQKRFTKEIDKYSVTHPLTNERLEYFKKKAVYGNTEDESLIKRHRFIQAKILAYSKNNTVFTNAEAIFLNKWYNMYYLTYKNILEHNNEKALLLIQKLLQFNDKNPFFYETSSIVYLNLGNLDKAKEYFKKALEYSNNNLFIKSEFASFLIKNFNDQQSILDAVVILESLKNTEEADAILYQNLQIAYKKMNMESYYLISAIEELILFHDVKDSDNSQKISLLIKKLEEFLKNSPNPFIQERLKRSKGIL